MSLRDKIGFIWQHRSIEDCFDTENPGETHDRVWKEYKAATELLGSGKPLNGVAYLEFMDGKWAHVYRQVFGVEQQIEKYKLGEVNE